MHWSPFFAPAYGGFARALRRAANARIVLLCHNLHPHEPGPLDRVLSRRLLATVDGALTLSESVADEVRALAPGLPVRRVAHPIVDVFSSPPSRDEARAALGLGDELVLLFFGFIRPYKGLAPRASAGGGGVLRSAGALRAAPGPPGDRRSGPFSRPLHRARRGASSVRGGGPVRAALSQRQPERGLEARDAVRLSGGVDRRRRPGGGRGGGCHGLRRAPGSRDRERHDFGAAIREARATFGWAPLVSALEEMLA